MTDVVTDPRALSDIGWDELQALDLAERAAFFNHPDGEHHVLVAQQFSRERMDAIGHLATCIRQIAKEEEGARFLQHLLWTKRTMLYFTQPSSRTFLSFSSACRILGMDRGEVRDISISSEVKGETREDSVRTFSSYYDMIIMRTEIGGFAERMAWLLAHAGRPVPIINAGSGSDQHPTQALLDIYTLQRSFEKSGGIDGKCTVFVGDLMRGRTVRSLAQLLSAYDDVRMIFVAPEQLQIREDILAILRSANVSYELTDDFESTIPQADAIYMTRVQDEWDNSPGESGSIDISQFSFRDEHLRILSPDAVLMHPFPRRQEIETTVDHDSRAVYWRQMRNGMWVRAALIAGLFGREQAILDYHDANV